MVVRLLIPSWGPGCPRGRVSSTANCSAPSRATRSSTTAIVVQAVSLPTGKVNDLEICSKSVPPNRSTIESMIYRVKMLSPILSLKPWALTGVLSTEVTVTLKSMAVALFFSTHTVTSPTPSLTSIVQLANSTLKPTTKVRSGKKGKAKS